MLSFQLFCIAVSLIVFDGTYVTGAPISGVEASGDIKDFIYYQLFTRKNPTEFEILRLEDVDALTNSSFNPNLPVKFFASGWDNDGSIAYPSKDEYLLREDCNVIINDWRLIQPPNYTELFVTTTMAGFHAGNFINFLIDYGTPLSAFHLIGHSAGTHLTGVASTAINAGKPPRITGLDVPQTWPNNAAYILDITDADFVDIIHTNGGNDDDHMAIFETIGHVDFYPNGGQDQPGCDIKFCSHLRAVPLFAESINSQGFRSLRCDTFEDYQKGLCDGNDVALMGDQASTTARGVYQLLTNAEAPFARG